MKIQKIAFCPDTHAPYHDLNKWELFMRAMEVFKPDTFVIGGDFADFYSVSDHDKSPERSDNLEDEIAVAKSLLKEIDTRFKPSEKIYVCGNHEDRLERFLMRHARPLWNTCKISKLLELDRLNWRFIPYRDHVQIGKLHITHDIGQAGPNAHMQALAAYQGNIVINHTHRIGYGVVGSLAKGAHVGAMFGWLGDLGKVDYMHKAKAARDWAHGFGTGYRLPGGEVHLTPVPIVNNRVIIEGKVVSL